MVKFDARRLLPVIAAAAVLIAGGPALAEDLKLSNKWRVEVSEGAHNAGTILFRVTPKDGQPVDVPVAIKEGRGENGVAQDIRDAFRATLDKDAFHGHAGQRREGIGPNCRLAVLPIADLGRRRGPRNATLPAAPRWRNWYPQQT